MQDLITIGIFHRTKKIKKKFLETQKTPNGQSNIEKEKQTWKNVAP